MTNKHKATQDQKQKQRHIHIVKPESDIVKPESDIVKPESDIGGVTNRRFKRGLMVPAGLSFSKKLNRLYWYGRYRSKKSKYDKKTSFIDWYGNFRSAAYQ